MFSNQISTRELFSGSQSTQENNQNDFSQLQHAQFTQFDMSQPMSQDFFSQDQFSAGSNSQSQGRRAPAIDKYISKPSLFRSNSQSRISTLGRPGFSENQSLPRKSNIQHQATTYQQQLSLQKQKAKERDERDMLSSIVSMVQECSDEVKQNLKCIRSAEIDSGEILQSSIKSLTGSLDESSNKILNAIKDREEHANQLSALHREIRQKDERIQELLQTKKSVDGEGSYNSSSLLESVKSFIVEQQSRTEQKIQRLLESTQEQLKLTKEMESSHRSGVEENNKHFLDIKYTNTRQVQDIEKRLVDELVTIRDDFDRQKRDLESFLRNQILSTQQKHLRDIEQHVQKSMIEGLRQASEKRDELLNERHSELKAMGKSQQRDLEKYIKSQTSDQTKQIIKQTQDHFSKQHKNFHKEIHQTLETLTTDQKQFIDDNRNTLDDLKKSVSDENKRPWQNENVPKMIQDKLNELHNYHQSEIKKLEAEIENQRKKNNEQREKDRNASNDMGNGVSSKLQNVYDLQQNNLNTTADNLCGRRGRGSMFKNGPALLSPRPPQGTWNSRALFCRPNPSPVATVLPQRKSTQDAIVTVNNAVQATQALEPSVDSSAHVRQLRNRHKDRREMTLQPDITAGQKSVRFAAGTSENTIEFSAVGNSNEHSVDSIVSQTGNANKSSKKKPGQKKGRKGKNAEKKITKQSRKNICQQNSEQSQETLDCCSENERENKGENKEKQKLSNMTLKNENQPQHALNIGSTNKPFLSPRNVFDFHEELSPGPVLRKRNKQTSVFTNQTPTISDLKSKWLAASDSTSGDSSADSSPSLSVTDLFIRTNAQDERRSPESKEVVPASDGFAALSDFLSTPNLTEVFSDQNEPCEKGLQNVRPLRRIAEKRKLCDFLPQTAMIQRSQKNIKH